MAEAARANLSLVSSPTVPSEAEHDRAWWLRSLFEQARTHRRPRVNQWLKTYRVVNNETWSDQRARWLPDTQVPEIFQFVSTKVAWMTDRRPRAEALPVPWPQSQQDPLWGEAAENMTVLLNAIWQNYGWSAPIENVVWDAHLYNAGFLKTGWDNSLEGGLGDVSLERVDPFTLYIDPAATCLEDANYIIEARRMSYQELDRRWPGAARKLRYAGNGDQIDERPTRDSMSGSLPKASAGPIPDSEGNTNHGARFGLVGQGRRGSIQDRAQDRGVVVLQGWTRHHSHEPTQTESGNRTETSPVETWQCTVVAGDRVLMDEPATALWGHGGHPYQRFVTQRTGDLYGPALAQQLTPAQLSINRLLAAIQLQTELTGNPVLIEDTRAGLQRSKIVNKPGQRLTKNPGGEVGWLEPPPSHPQGPALIEFYLREMERISGLSAMSRGNIPGGRNSENVLDAVAEANFVQIRSSLRNLERALQSAISTAAGLVTENYTAERMVTIIGDDGRQSVLALKARPFQIPTPDGALGMRWKIRIQIGSDLAISRVAHAQEADALYAMGALDEQAVLEAHQWPNRRQTVQRVMELRAQAATNETPQRERTRGR